MKKHERTQLIKNKDNSLQNHVQNDQHSPEKNVLVSTQQIGIQSFVGPLPPPSVLKEYDLAHPGLSERLVVAFEKEGDHRRELEKSYHSLLQTAQQNGYTLASRGQKFAFIVAVLALITSAVLGILGHTLAASIIAAIDIVGLTSVFLLDRARARKELPTKEATNPNT